MARSSKVESGFQDRLRTTILERYPGSMVFKMDSPQGIPDLLILYEDKWASLENKKSKDAKHQPNQDHYVERMNDMSFSRFVYPENREQVLDELDQHFRS